MNSPPLVVVLIEPLRRLQNSGSIGFCKSLKGLSSLILRVLSTNWFYNCPLKGNLTQS